MPKDSLSTDSRVSRSRQKFQRVTNMGLNSCKLVGATSSSPVLRQINATGRVLPAWLKAIRTEFRALFRFVRNDCMHNLRTISETQCYAILCQAWSLYEWARKVEGFLAAPH